MVKQRLGGTDELVAGQGIDYAAALGGLQRRADVDHRLAEANVAHLFRTVDQRDLVVVLQPSAAIILENAADAAHAEAVQFGRAQRAHARRAEHGDALGDGPQDLLVPDGRLPVEETVDDADRPRPSARSRVEFALVDRREKTKAQVAVAIGAGQRRSAEDDRAHRPARAIRSARSPS